MTANSKLFCHSIDVMQHYKVKISTRRKRGSKVRMKVSILILTGRSSVKFS